MSNRLVWFIAGSAAGVFASIKAKRAAERLSMPGLIDQASALGIGVRAFAAEMSDGMYAKETELRHALLAEPQGWEQPRDVEVVDATCDLVAGTPDALTGGPRDLTDPAWNTWNARRTTDKDTA